MILPQHQASLPCNPYAVDNLACGLYRQLLVKALSARYIQLNKSNEIVFIVFDIDRENGADAWYRMEHLPPYCVIVNPDNTHAHIVYKLKVGVHLNAQSNRKAIAKLKAIIAAMTLKLGADPCYTGLIAKNPFCDHWHTSLICPDDYDLDDLIEYGDLDITKSRQLLKAQKYSGSGVKGSRNNDLFELLRLDAYQIIREYRTVGFEAYQKAILSHAVTLNTFSPPLPLNEVQSTARSVARGVWQHMAIHQPSFIEKQRTLGKRSGVARKAKTFNQRVAAWAMHNDMKMKYDDIAAELNVSKRTVMRWVKEAKQADDDDTTQG